MINVAATAFFQPILIGWRHTLLMFCFRWDNIRDNNIIYALHVGQLYLVFFWSFLIDYDLIQFLPTEGLFPMQPYS
mgnify:CR=1 FL=1